MKPKNVKNKRNTKMSRKSLRKELRKQKKARRDEYFRNKNKAGKFVLNPNKNTAGNIVLNPCRQFEKKDIDMSTRENEQEISTSDDYKTREQQKSKREQQKLEADMRKQRKKQMKEANLAEDRNIKHLEKQLKLNKRKSKALPKSFAADGLDYLLEVCDSENMKGVVATEQQFFDSGGDFDEDFALMAEKSATVDEEMNPEDDGNVENVSDDSVSCDDESKSSSEYESDSLVSGSAGVKRQSTDGDHSEIKKRKKQVVYDSDSADGDDTNENSGGDTNPVAKESGTWEDIYGRLRGADGSIIQKSDTKYVPPAARAKPESEISGDESEKLKRLKRQLKGVLNRLAESNMHSLASQVENLYMKNSRNDMNDTLTALIFEALVTNAAAPERLLLEHVMLITILHANVGTEVGAHFLQTVVNKFEELYHSKHPIENKMLDNTVNTIAQLYNFKLFNSQLLYQILTKLSNRFEEKDVECILLVLKNVGFSLRKDDPLTLKTLILDLQKQAKLSVTVKDNARVKCMLDVLLAIKNNNVSKIPNYDPSYSEHLKKLLRNFIRKGNYVVQLNISLDDLLKAEEKGRWWIVGSAWSAPGSNQPKNEAASGKGYSQKLLDLAQKQRMNTDARRNVFCVIMTAEDYLDAFEKLLHLGLKNQQEREIIQVILHCCLQEKKFNEFYAVLAQKFCEYDRKYQMTIKYTIWDKLKTLSDCSAVQISNLAKLLTYLFVEKGLPISMLKIVQFSELDKITLRFIRQILLGILLQEREDTCVGVFEKVARSDKLKMFRESLRLFIHHFLLKNLKSDATVDDKRSLLETRAKMVEKIIAGSDKRYASENARY